MWLAFKVPSCCHSPNLTTNLPNSNDGTLNLPQVAGGIFPNQARPDNPLEDSPRLVKFQNLPQVSFSSLQSPQSLLKSHLLLSLTHTPLLMQPKLPAGHSRNSTKRHFIKRIKIFTLIDGNDKPVPVSSKK